MEDHIIYWGIGEKKHSEIDDDKKDQLKQTIEVFKGEELFLNREIIELNQKVYDLFY